jgi:hypothetical protein
MSIAAMDAAGFSSAFLQKRSTELATFSLQVREYTNSSGAKATFARGQTAGQVL